MVKQLRATRMEECIACGSCMLACARIRQQSLSLDRSAIRIRTAGGFRSALVADICLACAEPACAAVCSAGALGKRKGGGVLVSETAASAAGAAPRPARSAGSATTTTSATRSSAPTAATA